MRNVPAVTPSAASVASTILVGTTGGKLRLVKLASPTAGDAVVTAIENALART